MKYALSVEGQELLAQFAWSSVLLAFDFDGTLAPIVADREEAGMRARTRELLATLCERYPCAVISGRSRKDVAARLGKADVPYIIGNHGLEPGASLERFAEHIAGIRERLEQILAARSGIDVEDKRYSLAIHYRRSRRRAETRAAIHDAVAALPGIRIVPGKHVVNVVPADAPNKGDALLALRAQAKADTAIYVGDDVTDEDVFTLDQPGRLLSIRVGRSERSAAAYYVRDQVEVDKLLRSLLSHRAHGSVRELRRP